MEELSLKKLDSLKPLIFQAVQLMGLTWRWSDIYGPCQTVSDPRRDL